MAPRTTRTSGPLLCGVAGAGAFGARHANKLAGAEDAALVRVFDADATRARALATEHGAHACSELSAFLDGLDAVVVATPATTHARIAQAALGAGLHVLVEKPLALSLPDADRLIETASGRGLVLQVGHQDTYVAEALGLLDRPDVARFAARRLTVPSGRAGDVSVIMDLMIHDLELLARLAGTDAARVRACRARGRPADEVSVTLEAGGIEARLSASRTAGTPLRDLSLDGPDGTVRLDFLAREIARDADATPRSAPGGGDASARGAALRDPLGHGTRQFLATIRGEASGLRVTGKDGRAALRLALTIEEATRASM